MTLVVDFILVVGITITVLILFLLIKSKEKQLPKYILIVLFVFLLFVSIFFYADLHDIHVLQWISFVPFDITQWLIGPLLFLYIKSLFHKKEKLIRNTIVHFIPFCTYLVFISIPELISDIIKKPVFNYLDFYFEHSVIEAELSNLYTLFYLFLSFKLFSRYRKAMKSNYSNLTEKDAGWIKHLLLGSGIVISIDLLILLYQHIFDYPDTDHGYITVIAMILLISYLGYYGINQSKVLLPDFLILEDTPETTKKERIHHLSNSTDAELSELRLKLEQVLKNEKPYLDEELTLIKLAQLIPTTDKKLSALLNQYMNVSFYDIINTYRVNAVKEKINSAKYENYTLLGIAYECGFSSKTSFYRIFKKETGVSPSEYKNRL
ncbi:AraC family transcriptional regulator [Aquimarina sp. AU58]|uniref:helix-turn-helix domain-containing protein n=1 Tax=Aquimarina sp. AU58 TaxID=1874112 RepID=UPI000D6E70E5|nr:helix-turn-helix domain-containing protein [Aquimarina sp. AU58]